MFSHYIFYKNITKKLNESNINEINIIAGIHNKPTHNDIDRSKEYLRRIETILNTC